ncbi:hypothetical protein HS7_07950 [Sulfolobales archaeon HS-7]|nr:hypothetical protein HS7_07950 [Sulfolobales archaeon HS-7]
MGNRGKDYISLVRQGKKLGELLGKTLEFWELSSIFSEKIVLGFDETFLRVGEKEEKGVEDELFSGKVRSADPLSPVRCNVVTHSQLEGIKSPLSFFKSSQ